jgi:uncharacterized protein with HEPN domain/predicted nucleotidyltransferase
MNGQEIVARLRANQPALRAHGVRHAALFGSRARGDNRPDSDIDIMIEFDPLAHVTVFNYAGLKDYIAGLFKARLMLLTAMDSSLTFVPPRQATPFMPSESASAALRDMGYHIDLAVHFAVGFDYDTFREDLRTVYAVTGCLEIISEASRRLPDELKAPHPSIAWKDMAGGGNIYRHDYEDVAA